MNDEVVVSVCCLAYNQKKYIEQMLESIVHQKTSFRYEILISDDASTDGTTEVITEYAQKYPNLIRTFLQTNNMYSQGKNTMRSILFPAVRGKYVAFCEGDDYWCNNNKLQKQFDAMELHSECSICTHNVQAIYENGTTKKGCMFPGRLFVGGIVGQNDYAEFLIGKAACTFQLSSYFFRAQYAHQIAEAPPQYFAYANVGDEKYQRYCLNEGKMYFIEDVMSCYRLQSVGSWNTRENATDKQKLNHCKGMIQMEEAFDRYSQYKFHQYVQYGVKYREFLYLVDTKQYRRIFDGNHRDILNSLGVKQRIKYHTYSWFPWLSDIVAAIRRKE